MISCVGVLCCLSAYSFVGRHVHLLGVRSRASVVGLAVTIAGAGSSLGKMLHSYRFRFAGSSSWWLRFNHAVTVQSNVLSHTHRC